MALAVVGVVGMVEEEEEGEGEEGVVAVAVAVRRVVVDPAVRLVEAAVAQFEEWVIFDRWVVRATPILPSITPSTDASHFTFLVQVLRPCVGVDEVSGCTASTRSGVNQSLCAAVQPAGIVALVCH
jgi:hypothetical protein